MRFAEVTLDAPLDLCGFYCDELGLPFDDKAIVIGETRLRFRVEEGGAFYHFALLVPGDRFDAALAWAQERVDVLGDVFAFEQWGAFAFYFLDPGQNIVELIVHPELEQTGRAGTFTPEELVGFSEIGLVGDKPHLLRQLEALGFELWDGTNEDNDRLAFVGEKGRTFIVTPVGRGWLPTDRPAEPHPVETLVELNGGYRTVSTRRL